MAKARAIVKRRKAVRSIRKITQTMQLIATSRYQKCLQRAQASKPYTAKITEMISTLAGLGTVEHPLLRANEGVSRRVLLIITSNRGLCGSYNAGVLRLAYDRYKAMQAGKVDAALEVVGKKGVNLLKFLGVAPLWTKTDVEDRIAFAEVASLAERYMAAYEKRQIAGVDVAYVRFISVGSQKPTIAQLLPIEPPQADESRKKGPQADFEFSPPPEVLLGRLIPETVKIRLFQMFNEAIVSEQIARMVAMKAATEAAGEMIKFLTREYNRARQSQITMELADIVGGAEAVK